MQKVKGVQQMKKAETKMQTEKNDGSKIVGLKIGRKRANRRKCMAAILGATYCVFCFMLFCGVTAQAYIDPSVLTYVIQAVAGVAVAIGAVAGIYWRRMKKRLSDRLGIDENRNKEVESDDFLVKDDPEWKGEE